MGGRNAAHLRQQILECLENDLLCKVGILQRALGKAAGLKCFVVREERRERDGGECRLAQSRRPGESGVDLLGFEAVAASEGDLERPTETGVGEHRQKKGANELAVGKPDGLMRVGALDRENVNEDRLGALKENVEWGRVLEEPAVLDEVAAEVQG